MNIIVAVISFFLIKITNDSIAPYLTMFILVNIFLCTTNLLPIADGNDGSNILVLLKKRSLVRSFYNSLIIIEGLQRGLRISKFKELISLDISENIEEASSLELGNYLHAINILLDEKKYDEAEKLIGKIIGVKASGTKKLVIDILVLEYLFLQMLRGDFSNIESLYTSDVKKIAKAMGRAQLQPHRFSYTYEKFYKNNLEAAERHYRKFFEVEKNYLYKGDAELEKELLELAKNSSEC